MSEECECIPTHYGPSKAPVGASNRLQFLKLEDPAIPATTTFLFMEDDYLAKLEVEE